MFSRRIQLADTRSHVAGVIEMYADPSARGGVLEPEGVVEIKFRAPDLTRLMHRCACVCVRVCVCTCVCVCVCVCVCTCV